MLDKTIWVVEEGSYSDYRVVGVFSTKENADRVAALMDDYDKPRVVEWPLDPWLEEINKGRYHHYVVMNRDGEVWKADRDTSFSICAERGVSVHNGPGYGRNESYISGHVLATSEGHAIKIMNEHRARLIAEGKWQS